MNRYECLEFLVPSMTDQLVVGSLSGQRVEWGHMSRHPGNLLVASMGAALGMGIGLALVRRIVERHHGSVGAEGTVGEGATFFFTLPVMKVEEEKIA